MLFSRNADEHTLTQISFLTNFECWNNIRSSTLMFKRCFVNVEATSINIRQLNFRFQPDFNVETTLVDRRWIDVMLSTLFWQRRNNVDKWTSAQLSFSTKYQRWNNFDERWRSTLFQRWINVDVLAGNCDVFLFSNNQKSFINHWES